MKQDSNNSEPPSAFEAVDHSRCDEHPIDVAVAQRLKNTAIRSRISELTNKLMEALGDRRELWFTLEEALNDYRAEREEAYFNIGFEHGLAAGRAEALRKSAGDTLAGDGRAFADRIRDLTIQAGIPQPLTVAALLEVAWAIALGLDAPGLTSRKRGSDHVE